MKIDILSLFPEFFESPFSVSILKRAIEKELLNIHHVNIRDFAQDKHNSVDDRPYGGGPGMVLSCPPLCSAIRSVKKENSHVVCLSPQGRTLNNTMCKRLSLLDHLVLVCGHYEGIDQRVIDKEIDEVISIGDYVLTDGCTAALVLINALSRFIPGVLGNPLAAENDTFQNIRFEGPQYTKPEIFEGLSVPEVLRSGNHAEIKKFKEEQAILKMKEMRPDLYFKYMLEKKQTKNLAK